MGRSEDEVADASVATVAAATENMAAEDLPPAEAMADHGAALSPAAKAPADPSSSAKKAGPGRAKKAKDGATAHSKKATSSPATGMRGISSFLVRVYSAKTTVAKSARLTVPLTCTRRRAIPRPCQYQSVLTRARDGHRALFLLPLASVRGPALTCYPVSHRCHWPKKQRQIHPTGWRQAGVPSNRMPRAMWRWMTLAHRKLQLRLLG